MLNFRGNARLMVREPTDVLFHSRLMTPQPRVQAGGNPASIPVVVRSFDREGESSVVSAFGERLAAEVCEPGVRPGPVRILSKFGNLERLRPGRLFIWIAFSVWLHLRRPTESQCMVDIQRVSLDLDFGHRTIVPYPSRV